MPETYRNCPIFLVIKRYFGPDPVTLILTAFCDGVHDVAPHMAEAPKVIQSFIENQGCVVVWFNISN